MKKFYKILQIAVTRATSDDAGYLYALTDDGRIFALDLDHSSAPEDWEEIPPILEHDDA